MRHLLIALAILSLTACGEDPARNLYEGIKSNNDAKRTPAERATAPVPSYDDYRKERGAQSEK